MSQISISSDESVEIEVRDALEVSRRRLEVENEEGLQRIAERLVNNEGRDRVVSLCAGGELRDTVDRVVKSIMNMQEVEEKRVVRVLKAIKDNEAGEEAGGSDQEKLGKRKSAQEKDWGRAGKRVLGVPRACMNGWIDVVRYLVKGMGGDVDEEDEIFETGVDKAIVMKREDMLKVLILELGACIHRVNRVNETYLFAAVRSGSYEICKVLLSMEIDRYMPNKEGKTAAKYVKEQDKVLLTLFIGDQQHKIQTVAEKKSIEGENDIFGLSSEIDDDEESGKASPVTNILKYFNKDQKEQKPNFEGIPLVNNGLSKKTVPTQNNRKPRTIKNKEKRSREPKKVTTKKSLKSKSHHKGPRSSFHLVYTDEKSLRSTTLTKTQFRSFSIQYPELNTFISDPGKYLTEESIKDVQPAWKPPTLDSHRPSEASNTASYGQVYFPSRESVVVQEEKNKKAMWHEYTYQTNVKVMKKITEQKYAYILSKPWFLAGAIDMKTDICFESISDKLSLNCYACNHEWIEDVEMLFEETLSYSGVFCDVGKAIIQLRSEWKNLLKSYSVIVCGLKKPDQKHLQAQTSTNRDQLLLKSPIAVRQKERLKKTGDIERTASTLVSKAIKEGSKGESNGAVVSNSKDLSNLSDNVSRKNLIPHTNPKVFKEDKKPKSPISVERIIPITSYFKNKINLPHDDSSNMMSVQNKESSNPPESKIENELEFSDEYAAAIEHED